MNRGKDRPFWFYILVILIIIPIVSPVLWILICSLKTQVQIITVPPELLFKPTFKNYSAIFLENDFGQYFMNSFIVSFFTTLFSLLVGLPASYSIARYKGKAIQTFGFIIIVVRVLPFIAFLIPWYMVFSKLKLLDTYTVLIMCNMLVSLPLVVAIMVDFIKDVPIELEEAARIDGCTVQKTFLSVVLPIAKSGIVTVSTINFIFTWNNFIYSLTFSTDKTRTLPLAIYNFVSYAEISWGSVMAATLVVIAPAIILTMIFQEQVVKGMTMGAVKG